MLSIINLKSTCVPTFLYKMEKGKYDKWCYFALTHEEYNKYKEFKATRTLKMEWSQVVYVCDLFADVFSRQKWYPCAGCSPKPLIGMIDKLDKVFDAYEN